jgi:hypothetical protein
MYLKELLSSEYHKCEPFTKCDQFGGTNKCGRNGNPESI